LSARSTFVSKFGFSIWNRNIDKLDDMFDIENYFIDIDLNSLEENWVKVKIK
jgi:hypothetical protein